MIFTAEPPSSPGVEIAESYTQYLPQRLVAHEEPKWLRRQQYAYRRSVLAIEGGRVLLRLTETPMVQVDPSTMECEVVGWGVRVPCAKAHELAREMARRFLDLFSKADGARLTEAEQHCWMSILDQVDFAGFAIDRAAPHYLEGKLVRVEPVCVVEWHDGERQQIDKDVARALSSLRSGDYFGAYVKLGRENVVRSIERIVVLPAPEE